MDESSIKYNTIKKCDKKNNKMLFPQNRNLNNLKSNKYFTINNDKCSMKKALTKYRENKKININFNNNCINKTEQKNISISDLFITTPIKSKIHKNISFKVDKKLLSYAEPRTKVKEFYKIQPKIIESFILDNDNIESFFENGNNDIKKDYNNSNIINDTLNKTNKSNKTNKNNNTNKINKNGKNKKCKNENILFTLNNIESNENNDTIINEDIDFDDSLYNGLEIIDTNPTINKSNFINDNSFNEEEYFLTEIDDKNNLSQNINVKDINLEHLVMIEKLYNELIKDIEINKMEIYQNKLSMIKDFLYIFNSESNKNLFNAMDDMISKQKNFFKSKSSFNKNDSFNFNFETTNNNNDNMFLIIKEYLIYQIIYFYIIILIGLIKKEKNIYHSGLHNLAFYFHQNIIVFIYVIFSNFNLNSKYDFNNDLESINNYEKCIKILNENKTWLDKNNYKKYLQTNNKLSKQIIVNLLNQIKSFFNENPYNNNENQNKTINETINLLISYINSYKKRKILIIFKELQSSSFISHLIELIKINRIISHFSEEENSISQKFKNNDSTKNNEENEGNIEEDKYSIENNNFNEARPKPPFLKPISPKYKYTLVLDLDETLVHYISDSDSAYIQIRPGAEEFIKDLSEYYEIIIFTAALQTYADLVIDGIDPEGVISDRLYRQHTVSVGNANIKNLEKLGRDIKHVIIIDNYLENFSLQPKNGLNIIDFEGNEYDDELECLKEDLIKLVKLNPDDVRYYLKDIQIKMDKRAAYFQKLNEENDYKEELLNGKYPEKKNSLYSNILNKNNTFINNNNEKHEYSNNDESENIEEENI